jgi:nicotinamide-nucleotide adenylyltransferase
LTQEDPADPGRSDPTANPLTYYERYIMLKAVLADAGVDPRDLSIVPLPINLPRLYAHYVPLDAVFFITIYDAWGRKKRDQFQALNLQTEVLWERPLEQKGITGGDVRERMSCGRPWKHLVPDATFELMNRWRIPERLRSLAGSNP